MMGRWRLIFQSTVCLAFVAVGVIHIQRISCPSVLFSEEVKNESTSTAKVYDRPRCPHPFLPGFEFDRVRYERRVFTELPRSTLIIIGANVGDTDTDHTFHMLGGFKDIRKIFVEPIPPLFDQLTSNVMKAGIQNVDLVNAAIGDTDGQTKMYCWDLNMIGKLKMPDWFTQICSFSRSRLYNNTYDTGNVKVEGQPIIELVKDEYIVDVPVQQVTVKKLIADHTNSTGEISVVQIDTEGFDFHVMKQLPFEDPNFRPCVIAWEHVLLSDSQNYELLSRIANLGYGFVLEPQNIAMYRIDEIAVEQKFKDDY
ncbi:hypothetical protein ACHAWF_004662 [Thalassiosira exigua]